MRSMAACSGSPTRCSCSPRATSRSPPRSGRASSRRASSTSRNPVRRYAGGMRIGLIGAGNMARAIARGWGEPVLCSDGGSGRAAALAAELGGRAATKGEVAEEADLVVLCHKPYQLKDVAAEIKPHVKAVASVLGSTTARELNWAYGPAPVFRLMPNTPVEIRQGIVCYSRFEGVDPEVETQVLELFGRLGSVITL